MTPAPADAEIHAVRRFSRFYTRRLGLLEEKPYDSAFTLTETRVLYELAQREGWTAGELGRALGLDPGYLSRILKRFAAKGLVTRAPSPADGRASVLALTRAGRDTFAPLDARSHDTVAALLADLAPGARQDLVAALGTVERAFGPPSPAPIAIRDPRPGDLGTVVARHGALYAQEYGFDASFEALVAEIVAQFVKSFDPARERAFIADRDGAVMGSAFLVRHDAATAKIRLVYVEPSARGSGLGKRLVGECLDFARSAGYRDVTLWTNDCLHAARRVYESFGFRRVEAKPHRSFGQDLVGETWTLTL
ncbi:MAG TPA: helix-turn-helix domain-containing GNAT family N-acetyltransferase [Beijerinckiaceae bacterium]|jgi:DNA-binding MarR family transcriptional regulator/GNAT superfamily N-acetyltransferase